MSNDSPASAMSIAEASREYRRALAENYRHAQQGKARGPQHQAVAAQAQKPRPVEAQLPAALREVLQRAQAARPQRRIELLKYRHTSGDQVVLEIDDSSPLPPDDQLLVASVTTSLVTGEQLSVEVHMVIGAWQNVGR
jgi:hypothetical protein